MTTSPGSQRPRARSTARVSAVDVISSSSWETDVSGTVAPAASAVSSKPVIDTASGAVERVWSRKRWRRSAASDFRRRFAGLVMSRSAIARPPPHRRGEPRHKRGAAMPPAGNTALRT